MCSHFDRLTVWTQLTKPIFQFSEGHFQMRKLTDQSKELLNSKLMLRKQLMQVLPEDLVDYVVELIVRDRAHENVENLVD